MSNISVEFQIDNINKILARRGLDTRGTVQVFIDSETMRTMEPYMPFDTGMMARSMPVSTDIGSGIVKVNVPYAHKRLHSARKNGLRGPDYFARWKADHRKDLLSKAAKIAGGKPVN